jgi:nucleoside diphosphate kinase
MYTHDKIDNEDFSSGYCFILLRPETTARNLTGVMIAKIESVPCKILYLEMQSPDPQKIRRLYEKPELDQWRDEIVANHSKGKIVAILVKGGSTICHEISEIVKELRSLYGIDSKLNGIHSSDSTEQAIREAGIFFPGATIKIGP